MHFGTPKQRIGDRVYSTQCPSCQCVIEEGFKKGDELQCGRCYADLVCDGYFMNYAEVAKSKGN